MKKLWRRYVSGFALALSLAAGAAASFNYVVDPFWIYFSPRIEGFSGGRPQQHQYLRLSKAHAIAHLKPEGLIAGSSVAALAFDPAHPSWGGSRIYNAGLPGAVMDEIAAYFYHAQAIHPQRRLLLGLDFSSFNALRLPRVDFDRGRLAAPDEPYDFRKRSYDLIPTIFSFRALMESVRAVRYANLPPRFEENGFGAREASRDAIVSEGGHRRVILDVAENFIQNVWRPDPLKAYCFAHSSSTRRPLETFAGLLSYAHQNAVAVEIVLMPSHAALLEALDAAGLWQTFENWKRHLVRINRQIAGETGKEAFPIWDFAMASAPASEAVPLDGDSTAQMRHHWDGVHVKPAFGDLILDIVSGRAAQDPKAPIGVLLAPENLEQDLANARSLQAQYRAEAPDVVTAVQQAAVLLPASPAVTITRRASPQGEESECGY